MTHGLVLVIASVVTVYAVTFSAADSAAFTNDPPSNAAAPSPMLDVAATVVSPQSATSYGADQLPEDGAESPPPMVETPTPTPVQSDPCEKLPSRSLYCIYTVQSGDTLSGIAARFGISTSGLITGAQMLAESNKPYIADTNEVFAGQKLRIPAVSGIIHALVPGETLAVLAGDYGASPETIIALTINSIDASGGELPEEVIVPNPTRIPPSPPDALMAAARTAQETPPEPEAPTAGAAATPEPEPTATSSLVTTVSPSPTPVARPRTTARRTPTPSPPPRSPLVYSQAELKPLLSKYRWSVSEALRVIFGPTPPNSLNSAGCPTGESSGNTRAVGTSGERGIFQISAVHAWRFESRGWTWTDAFKAERNIAIAYEIYAEADGWWPWSCRPR